MTRPPAAQPSHEEFEVDLIFPLPPAPSPATFDAVGEEALRALVRYHHELLRRSSIGDIFPRDPKRFAAVVERIATFIVETSKGSPEVALTQGLTWFRSRHLPLTIDETARNVWLGALLATFDELDYPEAARVELWNWVEALSIRAITRRTMVGQPRRYPLAEAPEALRPFVESARRNARLN
ncbi:MAG: globin [Rhodocyclales bacterium]|nr:globin [Rhodocyclales bacterium]